MPRAARPLPFYHAGWRPGTVKPLLVLLTAVLVAAPSPAQDDDDDAPAVDAHPGLVAQFTLSDGQRISHVVDRVVLSPTQLPLDDRLARGDVRVRYEGQLYVDAPDSFTISAHVRGRLRVEIDGDRVVDVDQQRTDWVDGGPLELDFGYHALVVEYVPLDEGPDLVLAWSSLRFATETIAPRWLSHSGSKDALERFERGRRLTRVLRCGACHVVPAVAAPLVAPSLEHVAGNLRPDWVIQRLSGEDEPNADTGRAMPHFDLTRDEARDVVAALDVAVAPSPSPSPEDGGGGLLSPASQAEGERMFVAVGCAACHRVGDVGRRDLFGGSDLTRIADKRPADFFRRWLSDPAAINANHRMPRFEFDDEQLGVLGGFLASCRSDSTNEADAAVTDASLEHGRALLAERRCGACHALPEGSAAPQEAIAVVPMKHWDRGCLNGDDREMSHPHYVLSDDDSAAIVEFLRASSDVDEPAAAAADVHTGPLAWEANNCQACHRRDGRGGLADLIDEITANAPQLVDLTPVMRPPALDGVGEKFHAAALRAAIANPPVRRSWLQMRMPKFGLDDATLTALTDHFVAADRTPSRPAPDVVARRIPEASLTAAGRRLVTSDGFGCTSCHRIGRRGAGEKRPEALGPKLDMLGDRVRREWFDHFVREPTRMVSGLEMPSIMAPVSGVLGDDLADQLDAVWHVLNQPGFNPPEPGAVRIVRRSGHQDAGQRAGVITDVLRAGGRTFVKPLLIGLPNRHNVLFDLESAGLAGWWLGDVAEQRTEGKSWYWQARGEPVLDKLPGVDVRLLRDNVEIEPVREGQFRTEFDTLQYVDGGVRFTYRLFFPDASGSGRNCVHVAETITAVWPAEESQGGFRRLVELAGVPSADRVQLTIAESADASSTPIPADARRVELAADEGVSVEVAAPASARLVRAGRTVVDVPSDDSARIELVYRTHLVADQFPAVTVTRAELATESITTVSGFDGARLGLPREIMPVALDWRSDGALLIATLKGRVWIARDTDGDGLEDTATVFCDGLAAPYGLATGDGYVDVLNKYALLRLFDDDGDDVADRVVRLTSGWGHTADYHDWAVGLPRDGEGGYFAAFPCQQDDRSLPAAALRGAVVRFAPREPTGDDPSLFSIDVLTRGHRFPMGMARNRRGELFVTDNQGNYNPFNELNYIVPGARYGFINKLERSSDFQPPLTPPAIDIPHPWTRSVNGICFLQTPGADVAADASSFGPFAGHLVGCEYDTRRLVRLSLDRVDGGIQGAAYPLSTSDRATVDNFIGPIVCATSPDGDLYVGSIRDSGWGAGNNVGDVVRLRLRADTLPAGIREVRATADGFEVDFTRGVDTKLVADLTNYSVSSYRRISTPQYGGDDVDRRTDVVRRADVADDGLSVRLTVDDLRAGYLYELRLRNLAGGDAAFFPAEAYYTLRHIPAD